MINQPHAIGRATENKARSVHVARANRQQRRLAVATTDLNGDLRLR